MSFFKAGRWVCSVAFPVLNSLSISARYDFMTSLIAKSPDAEGGQLSGKDVMIIHQKDCYGKQKIVPQKRPDLLLAATDHSKSCSSSRSMSASLKIACNVPLRMSLL